MLIYIQWHISTNIASTKDEADTEEFADDVNRE